jgi:hypothetical protein
MSVSIRSGSTTDLLTVGPGSNAAYVELRDGAGNAIANADGAAVPAAQGAVLMGGKYEDVAVGLRVGKVGGIGTTLGSLLFWEAAEGATVNTARWTQSTSTMTVTQTAAGIVLGGSITANTYAIITSNRQFPRKLNVPLDLTVRARVNAVANSIAEVGFGAPSTNTATIANSAHWRIAGTTAVPVITQANAETLGSNIDISAYVTQYLDCGIVVEDSLVTFTLRNSATGVMLSRQELRLPAAQQKMWQATHLPVACRVYNSAVSPASAPTFSISEISLLQLDESTSMSVQHVQAGLNLGQEVIPATGLQVVTFANSAAPASATLSNTAAGYATLGGLYQFAAVAGAATDYALFGYSVPAPYSFYCTGIHISCYNTGAAVATTPTLLMWGLMSNSTAVSLATAAPRLALGVQSLPIGSVVGYAANDIDVTFDTPVGTGPGRFMDVILRMPVATATASQVVAGAVSVRGYFI